MEKNSSTKPKIFGFFALLKGIFVLLILVQFLPMMISNLKVMYKDAVTPKSHIGMISITGMLTDTSSYNKDIKYFQKNDLIRGLILRIDCGGGLPGTSQLLFDRLKAFKKEKPVAVIIENICTSGAYYVAMAANKIISAPSSMVGGIGVFIQVPQVQDLLESWKIKFHFLQSGKYKSAGNPLKNQTEDELAYLQELSDKNYKQFITDVAQTRNLDINDHETWANGKVFLGHEAKNLKLIDQVGSFADAIEEIKKIAKIPDNDLIKLVTPAKQSLLSQFFGGGGDSSGHTEHRSWLATKVGNFLHTVYTTFMTKYSQENTNKIHIA